MATITVDPASVFPASLTYDVSSTSSADIGVRTRTQVIADCMPGPLKGHLESMTDAEFAEANKLLELNVLTTPVGVDANKNIAGRLRSNSGLVFAASNAGVVATFGRIQLAFRHSMGR